MPEKFGTQEQAALFMLMRLNRDVLNTELTKENVRLTVPGRNKLNKAGLIASDTSAKPYVHRITEDGIRWCEEAIAAVEAPSGTGALVREMFGVLRSIVPLLRRHGIGLVDIYRSGADLESVIRAAYQALSVKPQDWVRLARLRPELNGADRDEVDAVLLEMFKNGEIHLVPESNRKALTEADHEAAIRIGSEDKHLMAIEES
ncbi:hypothetical protein ACFXGA_23760 [Actinosynnema sp. NPDC059335]|uniref:hypothetical protein n=1 Tax=Actinosynnema sp. NPDC059335 TaxID=3346804 RepID=UPI0036726157